jgi:hypothetical protein
MDKLITSHKYPNLSEISIKKVKIDGWLHDSNKHLLDKYIRLIQPKIILELGVWMGLSTLYMLGLFNGKIISVDNWIGGHNILEGYKKKDKKYDSNKIYNQFLRNLYDYRERVIPVKMDGRKALKYIYNLGIKVDLIYLDMDHTYESVSGDLLEIHKYYPNVPLIGDDYEFYDGVRKAVSEHIRKNKYNIEIFGNSYYIYKKNIVEYKLFNNLNYDIVEPKRNNTMNVLLITINKDNIKNIIELYNKTKTKYIVCIVEEVKGSLINSVIRREKNKFDVIVLLLNNYIIDVNTSYFFNNFPEKPLLFDKPEIFSSNRRISILSISMIDYYKIEGLPNVDNLEILQAVLYIRLSMLDNLSIIKYNFLEDKYISLEKIKVYEDLYVENSFKNGINSVVSKYESKKKVGKNIYKYSFLSDFPQHNINYYQQYISVKLNSVKEIGKIRYVKEPEYEWVPNPEKDEKVLELLTNNSPYFNKHTSYEEIVVNALYVLDIDFSKSKDVLVYSHTVKPDKSYHNSIKNIIDKNVNKISELNPNNIIGLKKKYDFIFINYTTNNRLSIILDNLKMKGSAYITYGFGKQRFTRKRFEILCTIFAYLFEYVYIYRSYSILGNRKLATILLKNKINDLTIEDYVDTEIVIDDQYLNNNVKEFNSFYKNVDVLNNYIDTTYNKVEKLKVEDKKKYKVFSNLIKSEKKKTFDDASTDAILNKKYLNL